MDGENRRSREAVRNSIRTYGVKVMMDPASLPLKKTKERESQESVSRFSEKSLHSEYRQKEGCRCLNRIPYATLLATIICCLGLLMFGVSCQRIFSLTKAMLTEVFESDSKRMDTLATSFMVFVLVTVVVGAMILILGVLTTGDTRSQVYSRSVTRVWGWMLCVLFMIIAFAILLYWLFVFGVSCSLAVVTQSSQVACDLYMEVRKTRQCMYLNELNSLLPDEKKDFKICDNVSIKKFCKDYLEKISHSQYVVVISSALVIVAMVIYLICLAANYTRIRVQGKFQELEELRHLDNDLQNTQGRF